MAAALIPVTGSVVLAVREWFDHPEVRRRLGGPGWLEQQLAVAAQGGGETFLGRLVLRTHWWALTLDTGRPVAVVGGDVYDRWTTGGVEHPGPAMGLAYVVDPACWRLGHGRTALVTAMSDPAVADVRLFALGIDETNVASRRCAESAGFTATGEGPDDDGDLTYTLVRS